MFLVFECELETEKPCFHAYAGWIWIIKTQGKNTESANGYQDDEKKI